MKWKMLSWGESPWVNNEDNLNYRAYYVREYKTNTNPNRDL